MAPLIGGVMYGAVGGGVAAILAIAAAALVLRRRRGKSSGGTGPGKKGAEDTFSSVATEGLKVDATPASSSVEMA